MKRIASSVVASLSLLSACGGEKPAAPAAAPAKPAAAPVEAAKPSGETPKAPAEAPKPAPAVDMDAAIATLMAKSEQPDEKIEVQHILIAFKGVPKVRNVTRTKEEAKALAEKVYAEVIAGGDFDALVKQYTNDSAPGKYTLTKAGRADWAKSFGDVGFRLKVGEIGVAPWDAKASPFG